MPRAKYSPELENLEMDLLLQAIDRLQGVNLREGSAGPVRRRVWEAVRREKTRTISGLQERLMHDEAALNRFLKTVLPPFVPYSAGFLQKVRYDLVPMLRTYPFVRIWQIGCNSVFETYCLAIILLEEGLAEKTTLYSTDVNESSVQNCRAGFFPLAQLEKYDKIYLKSGGRASLANYFSGGGASGVFDSVLRRHMVFSGHNLATDSSFNEFNAIFCRHPLKFFDRQVRQRSHRLLHESLVLFGILGLTQGDTLEDACTTGCFSEMDQEYNLYKKIA